MSAADSSMSDAARLTAQYMQQRPEATDEEVLQCLLERGVSVEQGHELIAFTPLAFARRAMRDAGVKFQGSFALHASLRIVAVLPLDAEPAYRAAWEVAEEFCTSTDHQQDCLAIAGRSAELRAINKLLRDGSKPENIVLSQPLLELPLRTHAAKPSLWKTLCWLLRGT